jgi:hypothetical protein
MRAYNKYHTSLNKFKGESEEIWRSGYLMNFLDVKKATIVTILKNATFYV